MIVMVVSLWIIFKQSIILEWASDLHIPTFSVITDTVD